MKRALGIVLSLGLAAFALGVLPADAQTPTEQRSRALFEQARQLAEANRWTEACPLFQAAHDLNSTGGTALQTANCYEKVSKLERALDLYQFILDQPDARKNPERVAIAEERVRTLRQQLGKAPDPLKTAPTATPSATPSVAPSATPSATPTARGTAVVPPPPIEGPSRVPAVVAFGAGGAGFVVGAIFGGLALSQASAVNKSCNLETHQCPLEGKPNRDAAITKGWVSNVGFGLGIVGVAVGVVLLATSKGEPKTVTANAQGLTVHF